LTRKSSLLLISLRRRVEYTRGFLELGMLKEAAGELENIRGKARLNAEVMALQVDLHMAAKHWDLVVTTAQEMVARHPIDANGWIAWAFALRELNRVPEAKEILLRAEPQHGKDCVVLHYNLACYHCLLGEKKLARDRLAWAFKMDKAWKEEALKDPDLKAMRAEIAAIK
jgi:predicted Zn-dependent protease